MTAIKITDYDVQTEPTFWRRELTAGRGTRRGRDENCSRTRNPQRKGRELTAERETSKEETRTDRKENQDCPLIIAEGDNTTEMADNDKMDEQNNYQYFFTFLKENGYKKGECGVWLVQEILTKTMDIADICLQRPHDVDGILFTSAKCVKAIFALSTAYQDIKITISTKIRRKPTPKMTRSIAANILTSTKGIAKAANEIENALTWMKTTLFTNLQTNMENTIEHLLEINSINSIHTLLEIAIQCTLHSTVLDQRLWYIQTIQSKAKDIEEESCYPWKYYWEPSAIWFLSYISKCQALTLGQSYEIQDIINQVQIAAFHRINDHNIKEEYVKNEFSHMFKLAPEKFDIHNPLTLMYPILKMVTAATFTEMWKEKQQNKTTEAGHQKGNVYHIQSENNTPNCGYTLYHKRNPDHTYNPYQDPDTATGPEF